MDLPGPIRIHQHLCQNPSEPVRACTYFVKILQGPMSIHQDLSRPLKKLITIRTHKDRLDRKRHLNTVAVLHSLLLIQSTTRFCMTILWTNTNINKFIRINANSGLYYWGNKHKLVHKVAKLSIFFSSFLCIFFL